MQLASVFQCSSISDMPTTLVMLPFIEVATTKLFESHTTVCQLTNLATTRMVIRVSSELVLDIGIYILQSTARLRSIQTIKLTSTRWKTAQRLPFSNITLLCILITASV